MVLSTITKGTLEIASTSSDNIVNLFGLLQLFQQRVNHIHFPNYSTPFINQPYLEMTMDTARENILGFQDGGLFNRCLNLNIQSSYTGDLFELIQHIPEDIEGLFREFEFYPHDLFSFIAGLYQSVKTETYQLEFYIDTMDMAKPAVINQWFSYTITPPFDFTFPMLHGKTVFPYSAESVLDSCIDLDLFDDKEVGLIYLFSRPSFKRMTGFNKQQKQFFDTELYDNETGILQFESFLHTHYTSNNVYHVYDNAEDMCKALYKDRKTRMPIYFLGILRKYIDYHLSLRHIVPLKLTKPQLPILK